MPAVTIIDLTRTDIQDGAKKVTNIQDSLSRQISAFKRARISPGVPPFPAVALNRVLVTAIKSDAGTPLPETSPMAKHR